jgi:hypothetical protein
LVPWQVVGKSKSTFCERILKFDAFRTHALDAVNLSGSFSAILAIRALPAGDRSATCRTEIGGGISTQRAPVI